MKTAIAYYSKHHGNTKKLIDAIAGADPDVVLIDVTAQPDADLSEYDRIGFASGIYAAQFHQAVQNHRICRGASAGGKRGVFPLHPRRAEGGFPESHAGDCGRQALQRNRGIPLSGV